MPSQELLKREFVHHLTDTFALMGAGEDMVNKIRQVEEKPLNAEIVDEIRKFLLVVVPFILLRFANTFLHLQLFEGIKPCLLA